MTRPLDALLLDASTEIALLRQRRETLLSEEAAARAEIVGTEDRFRALALQARRARMPRHLGALDAAGPLRQAADGVACGQGAAPAPWRPREEMAAPPPAPAPSRWQRAAAWLLGRPVAGGEAEGWPLLQTYPRGEEAPGRRSADGVAAYSLEVMGLVPRREGPRELGRAVQGFVRLAK